MKWKRAILLCAAVSLTAGLLFTGCGSSAGNGTAGSEAADSEAADSEAGTADSEAADSEAGTADSAAADSEAAAAEKESADGLSYDTCIDETAPEIDGLTYEYSMALEYAEGFSVHYYSDGYKYIDIPVSGTYLVVPDGAEDPASLPEEDTQLIHQDLTRIYLAATSSMSFFDALDAIDTVTMTGTNTQGWYIDAPKEALKAGTMQYAGKYSEPDYEMLVENDCQLALESTMIYHAPEVEEMLLDLGIPVFIDRSSYELTAFGRIEWIKVYGALLNKEAEADAFFKEQEKVLDEMETYETTGKTVAFFSVNSDGSIVVRKTDDFIPNMIGLAGGTYIFEDLQNPGSNSASVNINMEEFYDVAADADFLVYNATIEDPISDVSSLIDKDGMFAEFKAVQNGDVWQVDKTWYQSTATVGHLITDFHIMLTDGDRAKLTFLTKVGE